jgi:uncharacterized protein YeaO (DUF488 family)
MGVIWMGVIRGGGISDEEESETRNEEQRTSNEQWKEVNTLIKIKRIYEPPAGDDGFRILVDRLWPRGMSKDRAKVDLWLKEISPSNELRKWYGHDPAKWAEFKKRYFQEIQGRREEFDLPREKAGEGTVTFLFSSQEEKLNNAAALKEFVERQLK